MGWIRRFVAGAVGRGLCLAQALLLLVATSCVVPGAASPAPGLLEYQLELALPVPGGLVNLAGGNLLLRRVDLSIDTHLGTREIGASYNSASGEWLWSFDMSYDGETFVDDTGAVHSTDYMFAGAAIHGTRWVKVDGSRIATKGGWVRSFSPQSGRLTALRRIGQWRPSLVYVGADVSGTDRTVEVLQCRSDENGETCHSVYSIGYDEHGCVERIRDRAGRTALFESDASCRLLSARDGLDVARGWAGFRYEYNGSLLTAITNSEGERVEYRYLDGRIRSVTAIGEQNPVHRFAYGVNTATQLYSTRVDDPRGGRTVYRYDSLLRLRELSDAAGGLTTTTWEGLRPSARTDAAGVTTSWQFSGDDLRSVTLPSGNVVHYEYAPQALNRDDPRRRPVRRISDSLGLVEERSYDALGRLVAIENGAGETTSLRYDEQGNLLSVTRADGVATFFGEYGDDGHMRSVSRGGVNTRREYDAVGNLVSGDSLSGSTSPGRPGIVRRAFDEDRNLAVIDLVGADEDAPLEPFSATLTIESRSDGKRTRIGRPYGGDTEFSYDALGRLVELAQRVDGAWSRTSFGYDAAGQVIFAALPNGMRRELDRDAAGRETEVRLLRDGVLEKSLVLAYGGGRLLTRLDSSYGMPEVFRYDAAGRIGSVRFPAGEFLELGHDLRSREILRRFRASEGGAVIRTLTFGYDGADRRTRLLDEGQVVVERVFDGAREVAIRYGNGLERSFEYDDETGLLRWSTTVDAAGQALESTDLDWSECEQGLLCVTSDTSMRYLEDSVFRYETTSETYALGPPVVPPFGEVGPGARVLGWAPLVIPIAAMVDSRRYVHDALGNWLGVGATLAERFEYNPEHNRLLASDRLEHHDYSYDEAGYLVRRDDVAIGWDAGGRITSIGDDVELEWDVLGRPLRQLQDGVESRALFGGLVQGDAAGWPAAIDLGEVEILLGAGERIYRHFDFRGNVSFVTGESGDVEVHYDYAPYGVAGGRGSRPGGRSFAAGRPIGDFILLGARVYDPETGRFISPDPIYHEINQYAYTLGNPVTLWDPSGMHAESPGRVAALTIADYFAALAIALIGTGLMTGNPGLVTLGVLSFGLAIAIQIHVALSASGIATAGGGSNAPMSAAGSFGSSPVPASTPALTELSSPVPSVGCAPAALVSGERFAWPLLVLIALQLLLGAALSRRRGPRFESLQPRFESLQPRFESLQPRFESLQPRFESREGAT